LRKALRKNIADVSRIDEFDVKLLSLLTSQGTYSSKELAAKLDKPLSTVQRRIRILFENGYIRKRYEVDYLKLGWRKGVLNVYLKDGDPESVAKKVLQITGVIQVSVPLGDSDLSASVVYRTNEDALHLIRQIKRLPEVQSVTWTEEVLSMYATHPVIIDSLSDAI
jgi:DNA-binding Lrp family transcriptional regulator